MESLEQSRKLGIDSPPSTSRSKVQPRTVPPPYSQPTNRGPYLYFSRHYVGVEDPFKESDHVVRFPRRPTPRYSTGKEERGHARARAALLGHFDSFDHLAKVAKAKGNGAVTGRAIGRETTASQLEADDIFKGLVDARHGNQDIRRRGRKRIRIVAGLARVGNRHPPHAIVKSGGARLTRDLGNIETTIEVHLLDLVARVGMEDVVALLENVRNHDEVVAVKGGPLNVINVHFTLDRTSMGLCLFFAPRTEDGKGRGGRRIRRRVGREKIRGRLASGRVGKLNVTMRNILETREIRVTEFLAEIRFECLVLPSAGEVGELTRRTTPTTPIGIVG